MNPPFIFNRDEKLRRETTVARARDVARHIMSVKFLSFGEQGKLAAIGITIGTVLAYILHLFNVPVDPDIARQAVQDFMDQFAARV
jgi:hypothetical protein